MFLGLFTLRFGGAILRKNKHYPGFFFFSFEFLESRSCRLLLLAVRTCQKKITQVFLKEIKSLKGWKQSALATSCLWRSADIANSWWILAVIYLFFFNFYLFYFFFKSMRFAGFDFFLFCAAPLKKKIFFSSYFCLEFCYWFPFQEGFLQKIFEFVASHRQNRYPSAVPVFNGVKVTCLRLGWKKKKSFDKISEGKH